MKLLVYTPILYNTTLEEAIEYAEQFDFSEDRYTPQSLSYVSYRISVNNIDIYYSYGTDAYIFIHPEN